MSSESAEQGASMARAGDGRSPTIYDVAKVAGVSHQTVSRLLKGEGVRPKNRERVLQALEELGYRPNLAARWLATNKSHRVAVLTQEIGQVGPGRILQGVGAEARQAGYLLDIITLDVSDRSAIDEAIGQVNGEDIAGILALASTDEMIAAFAHAEFRVPAFIGAEEDDALGEHPAQRNARGLDQVVDHLVGLGHRRFFQIAGPRTWVAARNRELAYERSLSRYGIASLGTAYGDWSAASGYEAARKIPSELGITAVVAGNDQMALGAILALSSSGLDIPGDVSVTGFDDIPEAAYLCPPLTTVRLDFEEQGRDAFRRLVTQLEGRSSAPGIMTAELVERASSGPARSG
ncbi:LacI family transcriptional regulator [Planotetraspora silvatica]|uniref:LacI family transcriptional regulator n=1 Tax=Planotetraspora silvatica TaxID=234614 RepID=A0A8J3UF93_9ACTN|nr:LacI family DNA-binding transcriptional regulator [Planotetraspora silvatica]GII43615.1 LacI family transcriptional regulator [Planotetraspora silvatica]